MKTALLLMGTIVTFALMGCTNIGSTPFDIAKISPQIKTFLHDHPNAKITTVYLTQTKAAAQLAQYPECHSVDAQDLYFIILDDQNIHAVAFVNAKNQIVLCSTVQNLITPTPTLTATPNLLVSSTPYPTPNPTNNPNPQKIITCPDGRTQCPQDQECYLEHINCGSCEINPITGKSNCFPPGSCVIYQCMMPTPTSTHIPSAKPIPSASYTPTPVFITAMNLNGSSNYDLNEELRVFVGTDQTALLKM